MSRSRLAAGIAVLVVLAAVLVLVLLNRDGSDQPAPATVAAASTTPPTTQATPPPTTGGENWLAIMRQLMAYRHSLFTDPRPELLGEVYDRRCPCYGQDFKELTDLKRRGLHYDDQGVQVQSAKLVGKARDPSKPVVAVEVVTRQLPQTLVDAQGKVVRELPETGPTKTIYNLIRGADGRWRAYLIYRGLTRGDSP
ncbi:MAG TPA: hypothetical protein VG276_09840 [Actinomycetes bacterium]|jgi:hypothetical protein|nr:hypothetical protein [Actinomycetes bacterium]